MKYLLLLFTFFILLQLPVTAQRTLATNAIQQRLRCGTMEALDHYLKNNPQPSIAPQQPGNITTRSTSTSNSFSTNAIITIPVVVHLVLPDEEQAKVTEADVLWQIERLNMDFSGLNPDSSNGASFYSTRGHSNIRFCLAKRDPAGNPTNGINRVTSTINNFSALNVASLKRKATCGADSWDTDRYFNIWVAKSTTILGISTFPGTGPSTEQGIAIALDAFSNNSAYVLPGFNKGRTAVHETGHFLGLYHSWGDDIGCSVSDFRQLMGSCLIAGNDIVGTGTDHTVGDTPNQGAATTGCPSGAKNDGCNASVTGVQYQNFMDYTDDACYSMFTNLQVKRMEYMLTNCRSSLLTSDACTPVTQFDNDALLTAIINPGGAGCTIKGITNFCLGSTIQPAIEIKNAGKQTLTSLQIFIQRPNQPVMVFNWTGRLLPFEKALVNLPSFAANATGAQTITIYTAMPNGVPDQRTINDTLKTDYNVTGVTTLTAIEEGFNSTVFPPPDWRIYNPDSDLTWEHTTVTGKKRTGAAWFNNYDNNTNHRYDDLVTPNFKYRNVDSVFLHFQVASAMYSSANTTNTPIDTLSVLVSKDCGHTYTQVYRKWGRNLQTIQDVWSQDEPFFPRSAQDWRRDSVNLGLFLGDTEDQFQVIFRYNGNFENNIFLDDVNLYTKVLPQRLKDVGYLILPTVTQSDFAVWHYRRPTDLQFINVYSATGQLIVKKRFNGNADTYIPVTLSNYPSGIYFVQLMYGNAGKNVTQRIVKH